MFFLEAVPDTINTKFLFAYFQSYVLRIFGAPENSGLYVPEGFHVRVDDGFVHAVVLRQTINKELEIFQGGPSHTRATYSD